jgi:phospholipid N-methyltransferase
MEYLMTWLDRTLIRGDFLCLCTTEAEFVKELKRTKVAAPWPKWIEDDALATTHYIVTGKGNRATIVCMTDKKMDGIPAASLLVHEAVHVVQEYFRYIGEETPSIEFQAYSIQEVAGQLMYAYSDKLFKEK